MKRYRLQIMICILPVLFLSACNNWLDVSPEDNIKEEDLFSTGEGYRNALNGVYKALAGEELYGWNLTWGTIDAMGQCYNYERASGAVGDMQYGTSDFNFGHYQSKLVPATIWENAYNAVANCNNIVKNIGDADPEMFSSKAREKSMIWGEALALRAFIQFDMLRTFAPCPEIAKEETYIPYIREYPSLVAKKQTVTECLDHIIADLKEAKKLLWLADSLYDMKDRFGSMGAGEKRFMETRGYRLNYYATSGILARVYLYAGQKENAYQEAKAIIDFQDKDKRFSYTTDYRMSNGNIKAYEDLIAGFYSTKLVDKDREVNEALDGTRKYFLIALNIEDIFRGDYTIETENGLKYLKTDDTRLKYQIEYYYDDYYGQYYYRPVKYREQKGLTYSKVNNVLIPVIRMSEIYYIAGEAIYGSNPDEAIDYLVRVKQGRGLRTAAINNLKASITDFSSYRDALIRDARREFLGEGQIFYMYKRLNEPIPGNKKTITTDKFVMPLPDSQIKVN